ncbi:uncharacterized protein DS421_20g704940 [Arachis hypogaea]|nr:uncharacterized protein DS421_20g704940 [Arachis hypogaea]
MVKTKPRGRIESDRTEGQEPCQIDDPTSSKMVVDTGDPITLRLNVMDDNIIDLRVDNDTLPLENDDLQEKEGVDRDEEEEKEERVR